VGKEQGKTVVHCCLGNLCNSRFSQFSEKANNSTFCP